MNENEYDLLISEQEIKERVDQIADALNEKFENKSPIVLGVLKGSFMFYSDLLKRLNFPLESEFIKAQSYEKAESTGVVKFDIIPFDLKNRDILVVEDIVDTGKTLEELISLLEKKGVNSITTIALLDKPKQRKTDVQLDYAGFEIDDCFVVGYGLDYDQKMRNLPYIATFDFGKENN